MTKKKKFTNIPSVRSNKNKLLDPIKDKSNSKLYSPAIEDPRPSISLKYYDSKYYSLHELRNGANNLKIFDNFVQGVHKCDTWETMCRKYTAKPTNTPNARKKIKNIGLDPKQIEMFHLRASDKFRVHGFRLNGRFKLIWIDPHHKINK